jgi:HK97 family phage major capsid protein
MKKSNEIRKAIAEKSAEVQAIVELATVESRELSSEEKQVIDRLQGIEDQPGEIANLEKDLERAIRFESRVKQIANTVGDELSQPRDVSNLATIRVPARARSGGTLKAFENSADGERDAYIAGHVVLGGILGRQSSLDFLANHGLVQNAMSTKDGLKGGFLVPEEMAAGIVRIRDARGVFARYARQFPMGSEVAMINRLIGDVTAYWVGEGSEVTLSDAEIGQAKLVASNLATLTKLSKDIDEEAVVAIGDLITTSAGYAMADKIDSAGFNGDGGSTYGGVKGLANALNSAAIVDAASSNVSAATLDLSDFESVVGLLPEYDAGTTPRWYMNKTAYWNSARRLMNAAGGNTIETLGGEHEPMFMGYPVTFAQVMSTGTAVSTIVAYFGHLELGATLGTRRGISFSVSTERYFETRQLGIMVDQKIAINVHETGDTVRTRPIVALKTAAS